MLTMDGSFDFLNRGIHLTANCLISLNLNLSEEDKLTRYGPATWIAVMFAKSTLTSALAWCLDDILVNRPELLFEVLNVVLTISLVCLTASGS